MLKASLAIAKIDTKDKALVQETLRYLRNPHRMSKVPRWRWETMAGRVLARGEAGKVTIYRTACREELGEDV